MPLIDARALCRSYGARTVLKDISLTLGQGERVGLIGDNGCGKSTLARIVAGVEAPDGGELSLRRGCRVAYLSQTPDMSPERSAREIVLSGLSEWYAAWERHGAASRALEADPDSAQALQAQADAGAELERLGGWDVAHRAESVLRQLGVADPDKPAGEMSGGQQRRVAMARILVSEPDLAILDEPTNHLDLETIEWLEGYLRDQFRGGVLLVTHDRHFLDEVVQRTLELADGTIYAYRGGYATYLEAKAERLAHAARTEANRQNFLRRELQWLRRSPQARTTKQKARVSRAEAAIAVDAPKEVKSAEMALQSVRSGRTLIELEGLDVRMGEEQLVSGLDFWMGRGERIAVVGPNGCGKTTLLRTILGEHPAAAGRVTIAANTRPAYLSQTRDGLDEQGSVFENVSQGRARIEVSGADLDMRSYLQRFLFDTEAQRTPVAALSGGERTRVALAKLLSQEANLVILDEPTNDLDVSMLSSLESMLLDFAGGALIVSHDRWFLNRVSTAVLAWGPDGIWERHEGDYDDYRARVGKRGAAARRAPEAAPQTATSRPARGQQKKRGLTYAERLELEGLVGQVEAADARVSELERTLADPALYSDPGSDVGGLTTQLGDARAESERLMARWEVLETKQSEAD